MEPVTENQLQTMYFKYCKKELRKKGRKQKSQSFGWLKWLELEGIICQTKDTFKYAR